MLLIQRAAAGPKQWTLPVHHIQEAEAESVPNLNPDPYTGGLTKMPNPWHEGEGHPHFSEPYGSRTGSLQIDSKNSSACFAQPKLRVSALKPLEPTCRSPLLITTQALHKKLHVPQGHLTEFAWPDAQKP